MATLFCGLVALPALVLWSFRAAGFVSDDIFFGPGFHLDSWREIWLGPWPHPMGLSKAWRPVVVLTYLAESAWPDAGPTGYHLFNYLLHGLSAALLSVLVWQLAHERVAAAVAGVLFAVHPIVHENVQWISGRTYPVAALFILALCVWTAGAPRRRLAGVGPEPVLVDVAYAGAFCLAGYLSAAGVAALIGTAAISLKERPDTMRRAAFAVLLSAMAIGWAVSLRGHGREWDEAGRSAASLLGQLREQEPPPEQPLALHVIDVPVRHGSALLFLTYFPLAVWRRG
jgi:hypothetical protein